MSISIVETIITKYLYLYFFNRGDHTVASSNLFVLPPHTEAVVFSIDGALCSNFSLSGRDLKIKECSVDVARYRVCLEGRSIVESVYCYCCT